jgi:diadenosine tetraphosphate (Ap4A) HIT family hydrolase
MTSPSSCIACDLTSGASELPGGRIFETSLWVVEHCVGPLGVGTLIVKPFRHCLHLSDLTAPETQQLGPLLQRTSRVVQRLCAAEQVYACLWSHANWVPGHIHFVVQPAWGHLKDRHVGPGPSVQAAMFNERAPLDRAQVEAFCDRARQEFARRDSRDEQMG